MSATVNIGRTIARERRRLSVTQEVLAAHFGVLEGCRNEAVARCIPLMSIPTNVSIVPWP